MSNEIAKKKILALLKLNWYSGLLCNVRKNISPKLYKEWAQELEEAKKEYRKYSAITVGLE